MILPIAILSCLSSAPSSIDSASIDIVPAEVGLVPTSVTTEPITAAPSIAEQAPAGAGDPPKPGEPAKWTGSLSVGASYSDGNTDARSVNAAIDAVRRAVNDRWTFKGYWNYGEQRNTDTNEFDLTQRREGASLKYDYFMSKKLYLFGVGGVEADTLADIKFRYYVGPGVGYQWREDDKLKWGSEAGATWFSTDYDDSDDKEYIAARVANNIAWKINDNVALENNIELFPSLENAEDFNAKSDTKVKVTLSKAMFAQLQWVYQFNNQPADDKERVDNLLVLGVGWSF